MTNAPSRIIFAATIALVAVGCQEATNPVATEPADGAAVAGPASVGANTTSDAALGRQLARLRAATARFHDYEAAVEAGYEALVEHPTSGAECLEHPTDGGMGRHYLKPALAEDDQVAVLEPEVVIYEPMKNGKLRLVGFEYVVPYPFRGPGDTPPTLFGRDFLHNDTFGLWMLHVYAWKNNPSGIFATWNPKITCEHDGGIG